MAKKMRWPWMTRDRREGCHGDVQRRQFVSITDATFFQGKAGAAVLVDTDPASLLGALVAEKSATDAMLRRMEFVDQYCRSATSQRIEDALLRYRGVVPHRVAVLAVTEEDDRFPVSIGAADALTDLGAFGVCQQWAGNGRVHSSASRLKSCKPIRRAGQEALKTSPIEP